MTKSPGATAGSSSSANHLQDYPPDSAICYNPGTALPKPHRKRVQHFDDYRELHELTFSCYKRQPILDDDWRREQLSTAIDCALDNHDWRLAAFVYMPEPVHLLVYPVERGFEVDKLLFAIKRPFSFRVKRPPAATDGPLHKRLTVRQRPGKKTFRFWQEGPGYDRNRCTEKALHSSIDYIHQNPIRRRLVRRATNCRWSSMLVGTPRTDGTSTRCSPISHPGKRAILLFFLLAGELGRGGGL